MKRLLGLVLLGLVAADAHAFFLKLNIIDPNNSASVPPAGTVDVVFAGSVTCDLATKPISASFAAPCLINSSVMLGFAFDTAFLNYVSSATFGDSYVGDLFAVSVKSTDLPGLYGFAEGSENPCFVSVMGVTVDGNPLDDVETYSLNVDAVPEPATSALVLGVAALLRRRKWSRGQCRP